jgi:hypothetical protein
MKHELVVDKLYDSERLGLLLRLRVAAHIVFCSRCAKEAMLENEVHSILTENFFPKELDDVSVSDAVMSALSERSLKITNEDLWFANENQAEGTPYNLSGLLPGVFVILSLLSSFFSFDFAQIVALHGDRFLVPVALTVGLVITIYCALFINRHIEKIKSVLQAYVGVEL